jgi:hypothetical protein
MCAMAGVVCGSCGAFGGRERAAGCRRYFKSAVRIVELYATAIKEVANEKLKLEVVWW